MNQPGLNLEIEVASIAGPVAARMIDLFVAGEPRPKGSWKAILPRGSRFPRVICDNQHTRPWQSLIGLAAGDAMAGRPLFDGPIRIRVEFVFRRPASVKRKSRPLPSTRPDIDKLLRTIMDALQGVVYTEDSRVVEVAARKVYDDVGVRQGATIHIEEIC
jgi:crossover junction endodeoxyribonuclease RusA